MTFLNQITGAIFGGLTRMISGLPDWLVLTIHGTLLAILALFAYALFSNQAAIKRTKNRLMARLLEIRLFQDDPLLVLASFGRVLTGIVVYMKDSLKPLIVMLPIVVLWIAQLAGWFEWRPLNKGESVVVKATLKPDLPQVERVVVSSPLKTDTNLSTQPATLEVPAGFQVDTPAFHSTANHEILWRVSATGPGSGPLVVKAAGSSAEMPIVATGNLAEVAPRKLGASSTFWDRVLYPMDKPLAADSAFNEISISYPERTLKIIGFEVNWMVWLLLVSIILGFALKKPFGVEF
jgi:hypothetical protein